MTATRRFTKYVVERAQEELERAGLPGSTRSMLEAFIRDGERALREYEGNRSLDEALNSGDGSYKP